MSLRTLMFGWEYPPKHSGGLGVACQGLVRGLLKHGVGVTLVLPSSVDTGSDDVDVRHPTTTMFSSIAVTSDLQPYDSHQSYHSRQAATVTDAGIAHLYGPDLDAAVQRYTELSVEMTKDVRPDVIHCHDWMTLEAGIRASSHHQKPLVAHVHATELDRTHFRPNEWIASRERTGLMKADKIIAVSAYTKNMLTRHYGIPADRIAVVHNGHDPHRIAVPQCFVNTAGKKNPLVLFLGRLTVQKNPWQFLEIARRIREHRPETQFVMAGDGPMLPELIDRACAIGLQDSMVFAGKVNNAEALSLYAAADCFVMPSVSEPFGLVALEAIAHGTPVIVSKQSGVSEVLDHAFKVDYWDAAKMADCILTILREQPLARQLRSEAPRLLRRLSWQNQAAKVQSVYHDLIQSHSTNSITI